MHIDLELRYPLYLRRLKGEEMVAIIDYVGTPVAQAVNYNHAYEIVRLANCAYKLMSDLSEKASNEQSGKPPRDLGLSTPDSGLSDPSA
jgi:hypothetical protein